MNQLTLKPCATFYQVIDYPLKITLWNQLLPQPAQNLKFTTLHAQSFINFTSLIND